MNVDVYKNSKATTFQRKEEDLTIMTVQVISSIEIEKEAKTSVTLSKKAHQEVERLLKRMFD